MGTPPCSACGLRSRRRLLLESLASEGPGGQRLLAATRSLDAECADRLREATIAERAGDVVRFQAACPIGGDFCGLSNLYGWSFRVDISVGDLRVCATDFSSVEAFYQGLKFNRTEEFGCGGKLEGRCGLDLLDSMRPGDGEKLEARMRGFRFPGFVPLFASRLWGNDLEAVRRSHQELAQLDRRRRGPFFQVDLALMLLACQLFMYAAQGGARALLRRTKGRAIEEYSKDATGANAYSRYRPDEHSGEGDISGLNLCGQNLMHIRAFLFAHEESDRAEDSMRRAAEKLLASLEGVITGKDAISSLAERFYCEDMTYAALLEQEVPTLDIAGRT